jgi:hypothetical protein
VSCSRQHLSGPGSSAEKRGLALYVRTVSRSARYRKRRLESWIPLDRFLDREIVQFFCELDAPDRVECPRGQIVDEQAVVVIDIGCSDIVESDARDELDGYDFVVSARWR